MKDHNHKLNYMMYIVILPPTYHDSNLVFLLNGQVLFDFTVTFSRNISLATWYDKFMLCLPSSCL